MAASSVNVNFIPTAINGTSVSYSASTTSGIMRYGLTVTHKDQGKKLLSTITLKVAADRTAALGTVSNDKAPATLNISFTRDKALAAADQAELFNVIDSTLTNTVFDKIISGQVAPEAFAATYLFDIANWSPVV